MKNIIKELAFITFILFSNHLFLYGQKVKISGHISDGKNNLIYTRVENVGKNEGVITDSLGLFAIELLKNDTLTISHVGFIPQKITNFEEKKYDIILEQKITQLSEIVISPSKKRELIIGSNAKKPNEGGFHVLPGIIIRLYTE